MTTTSRNDIIHQLTESVDRDAHSLASLLEELSVSRTTTSTRKAAARKVIEEFDLERLIELQDKMSKTIDVLMANELNVTGGVLSPDAAQSVMAELLDERDIVELLDVRKSMIRSAVFNHITAVLTVEGDLDPEHNNGELVVSALGKKFTREGGSQSAATLDDVKLRAALGERAGTVYDVEIVPAQVIPERIEQRLNAEALVALAQRDPAVMEIVRDCLVPGGYRTPRFHIRDL